MRLVPFKMQLEVKVFGRDATDFGSKYPLDMVYIVVTVCCSTVYDLVFITSVGVIIYKN